MGTMQLRIVIDVPALEAGIAFYTQGLGLTVGRRREGVWVELLGGPAPIDLVAKEEWSGPFPGSNRRRQFNRHWTPVHLDVVVEEIEPAVKRLVDAGAQLERPIEDRGWGKIAGLADPFGHGLCVLAFQGQGYDALADG
jgi:predicted enzyme related to lactoylglutathione lyase